MLLDHFLRRDVMNIDGLLAESTDVLSPLKATLAIAPEVKAEATTAASKARAVLKKPDRVLWFMRLYNLALLRRLAAAERDPERSAALAAAAHEATKAYESKMASGARPDDFDHLRPEDLHAVTSKGGRFPILTSLEHFLSYPIPEIQSFQFGWLTPTTVEERLRAFEAKWAANQKDKIEPAPGDKVLLNFPNGYAWLMLDRAYCPKEAEAMGHCGNEPRKHSGDRILSLRRVERIGAKSYHKPYLTFILHDDGMLGEMKGRFNLSPKNAFAEGKAPSDFHEEIVALLGLPMIKGIVGGGYMPEQNFSLDDLDSDTRMALLEQRPELGGIGHVFDRYGMDDEHFWPVFRAALGSTGLSEPDYEPGAANEDGTVDPGDFVLARWPDFRRFVDDLEHGSDLQKLVKFYEDLDDEEEIGIDENDVYDILAALPDDAQRAVSTRLATPYVPANSPDYHAGLHRMARAVMDGGMFDIFDEAARESSPLNGGIKARVRQRLEDYIRAGWPWACWYLHLNIPRLTSADAPGGTLSGPTQTSLPIDEPEGDLSPQQPPEFDLESEIKLTISVGHIVDLLAADGTGTEDDQMLDYVKEGGWTEYNADSLFDRRHEEVLTDSSGIDRVAASMLARGSDLIDHAAAARLIADRLGI